MRRPCAKILAVAALALLALASCAQAASFGLEDFDVRFAGADGSGASGASQAGSHPFEMTVGFDVNTKDDPVLGEIPAATIKDIKGGLLEGLVGNPTAVPRCSTLDFMTHGIETSCPNSAALGYVDLRLFEVSRPPFRIPVYNLVPPPGVAMKIGFWAGTVPVTVENGLSEFPPYNVVFKATNTPQPVNFYGSQLTLWGNPQDPAHDPLRGHCLEFSGKSCPADIPARPFLTLPRACLGPLASSYALDAWENPGSWVTGTVLTHDDAVPPAPLGFLGCSKLGLAASISSQPTAKASASPTGLDFSLDVGDEGLGSPSGVAQSDIRKAIVTLPEGMSVNPSQAEGLAVCSEEDLARESATSAPGAGCPPASKIGTIEVETPLLEDKVLKGALYVAKPYENPFGSLIALYIVIKNPELGISVIQPAKVTPDPVTGQLVTTTEEMPQLPFSHFRLHFREGTRSPLATPPACGRYDVSAKLYPYSGNPPVTSTSAFEVISGPDNSPCPKGGLPPFHPQLEAGTLNNAAGRFSPFDVKITRADSEQEITHFSIKLPPGVAGKLAGIPFCSDAQIARAKGRTGPHGGAEELADPSCPAASQVGRTLAGAGVGPALAYAPGRVYLAGPYHGHPLSLVAITAGVVGPFDIGTVVVRLAIDVNPETGEVFLDSTGSDPIPHIIKGIPVHLRDIRAYTDRPEFTYNPTSCERKSTAATVLGSGLDFASPADDNPFVSTSSFQAADCAALPFEPKLTLRLLGGTKRGQYPKLKAFLRMRGFGEAGVARAQVTLPRSEFIANAHFNTICTRAQFKEDGGNGEACPPGSIYGFARAKTPVLTDPLEGPVFLRSSEHQLPDVVASLQGQEINVHLVGRVDSVKGRLRTTFETVPDAPVEWASFSFQGAKKGLFENSTNLCAGKHRAEVDFTGQNGKVHDYKSAIRVKCGGKGKGHRPKRAGH